MRMTLDPLPGLFVPTQLDLLLFSGVVLSHCGISSMYEVIFYKTKADTKRRVGYEVFQHTDDLDVHNLIGWEEIRSALEHVESIRREGLEAKVEIENSNTDTILRFSLRSTDELDEYFNSHLRQLILQGLIEDTTAVTGRIHLQ